MDIKKTSCLAALILLLNSMGTARVDPWLKFKLKAHLSVKPFALLRVDGIPALPPKGLFGKGISVLIHDGGAWTQETTMGMKRATNTFINKNELLEIHKIRFFSRGIALTMRTFRKLPTKDPSQYRHHETRFKFFFPAEIIKKESEENLGYIIHCLEKYFHFAATPEEARKAVPPPPSVDTPPAAAPHLPRNVEIRLGMTRDDVESILGSPQCREFTGTQMIYQYPGITVVFENGKVKAIRFQPAGNS
ncbi:MAG TPA: hypothetical protein ENN40_02650 [Candidatus Aminicenantes bacterium]|nr:hypothetical protein [Candidatus Aminicenantes bacterium]